MLDGIEGTYFGREAATADAEIERMAITARLVPPAAAAGAHLVDIGGTVPWIPVHAAMGYSHIGVLRRDGGDWLRQVRVPGQGERFEVEALTADAERDPYPLADETVDCVVCFQLLEHFALDPMHCLAEVNRILKPGGTFCLTTPNVLWRNNLARFAFGGHPFGWSAYPGYSPTGTTANTRRSRPPIARHHFVQRMRTVPHIPFCDR